ncbi:unnamed protein product, partial [Mesorhabditis belari]|uniref:Uncharacterized protein n=1 Tax=Mesorhabditis belari TaxID=2138241 RepID=A0AAF3F9P1_9BILA
MIIDLTIPSGCSIYFGKAACGVTERLRLNTFRNVLSQDGTYFDSSKHSPGKVATRLATDTYYSTSNRRQARLCSTRFCRTWSCVGGFDLFLLANDNSNVDCCANFDRYRFHLGASL